MNASQGRPAFIATSGGHLVQLNLLSTMLEPEWATRGVWVTQKSPQSESILSGRDVLWAPTLRARSFRDVLRTAPHLLRELRHRKITRVYSTGAALALAVLPWAPLCGFKAVYVESLARSKEFSATGRVLRWVPWVDVRTQYEGMAQGRWRHQPSLLRRFSLADTHAAPTLTPDSPLKVFVTLGTARPWGFDRLVARMTEIARPEWDLRWQTGVTDPSPISTGEVRDFMSAAEFAEHIDWADVIVSHSGVGSLLTCLQLGKAPVLVPRRSAHGEHVDDHQAQIADVSSGLGLSLMREADALTADDLVDAANRRIELRHPVA